MATYSNFILKNTPRVLSQIDRDPSSSTYGCCDRNFWHLRIRDFPSAILQQTGLMAAMLYQLDFEGNIYHNNLGIKNCAEAAARYWAKIQLRDGTFNEYYPNEHGFPPTAFTLLSTCQIYSRLQMQDEVVRSAICKTAQYLSTHNEIWASNQECASIAGLYAAWQVIGGDWILAACQSKLEKLLKTQSLEGWLVEQGGADIGYLSVALDMLCEYYYLSGDESAAEPIRSIVKYLSYFVHPDGSVGGEYASRNTTYFLPGGVEMACRMGMGEALAMKERLYGDTARYNFFMDSVDERYMSHYVMHSYLRALEKEQAAPETALDSVRTLLPYESGESRYFPECGMLVVNRKHYSAVIGLQKGGVMRVFKGGEEVFNDSGYRVELAPDKVATTNWQNNELKYSYQPESGVASVKGEMNVVKNRVPSPLTHLGLRAAALVLGKRLNTMLKKILIFQRSDEKNYSFTREIRFEENSLTIQDVIEGQEAFELLEAPNMSLRCVASGRFFTKTDLFDHDVRYPGARRHTIVTDVNLKALTVTKKPIPPA